MNALDAVLTTSMKHIFIGTLQRTTINTTGVRTYEFLCDIKFSG